jgi:hypothetical protein
MPPPFLQPSYALRSRCEAAVESLRTQFRDAWLNRVMTEAHRHVQGVARARWRGALRYLRLRTQNDFPVRVPGGRELMRLLHFCERQHRCHTHF